VEVRDINPTPQGVWNDREHVFDPGTPAANPYPEGFMPDDGGYNTNPYRAPMDGLDPTDGMGGAATDNPWTNLGEAENW
jgi:hypothetical protein